MVNEPYIKVRVIAEFEFTKTVGNVTSFVQPNSYLFFDVFDSTEIAEIVTLYSETYPYKEFIELPSFDSLPHHVKEQINSTYNLNKPLDAEEPTNKEASFYETHDESFSPYGNSGLEEDKSYHPPVKEKEEEVVKEAETSLANETVIFTKEELEAMTASEIKTLSLKSRDSYTNKAEAIEFILSQQTK